LASVVKKTASLAYMVCPCPADHKSPIEIVVHADDTQFRFEITSDMAQRINAESGAILWRRRLPG